MMRRRRARHRRYRWSLRDWFINLNFEDEAAKLLGVPLILLVLDIFFKLIIGVSIDDVGSDMALLGVSTFAAILVEDTMREKVNPVISLIFFLLFFLPWVTCLWTQSSQAPHAPFVLGEISINASNILVPFSWFIGILTLGFANTLTYIIVSTTSDV